MGRIDLQNHLDSQSTHNDSDYRIIGSSDNVVHQPPTSFLKLNEFDSNSNLASCSSTTDTVIQNNITMPSSNVATKQEHSDTESLNKYEMMSDRTWSKNSQNHHCKSRSRSNNRRRRRRSRTRSSSYRFRHRHSDSDRSSVDSEATEDSDRSATNDSEDSTENDDDDHRCKRYRRYSSTSGNHRNSNSTTWNLNNDGRKSFNRQMSSHDHRRRRYNQQPRSNNHVGSKYSSYTNYTLNPTSSSNIYQQEGLNFQSTSSALYFPITEPYNPEDAIFNQSLLNYGASNLMTTMMNNNSGGGKLRHRQLVNVSLITNENDESDVQNNRKYNINNNANNNIELTTSYSQLQENNYDIKQQRSRQQRFDMKKSHHNRSSTLLIQKIPVDLNRIDLLNDHFQKFGSIIDIKIGGDELDPESALIQYSSPFEANRAYRSTEPVLNNRFIKVFWANREQTSILENKNKSINNTITWKPSFVDLPIKRKFPIPIERDQNQDLKVDIANNLLNTKKFKSTSDVKVTQTQPIKKVLFGMARKRQLLLLQQWRQQSDDYNRKLEELFCNQRHLMNKLEAKQNDSDQTLKQNLKKLIQSNMKRIEEIKQKLLDLQELIKSSASNQTSRVYNVKQKKISTDNIVSAIAVDAATEVSGVMTEFPKNVDSFDCEDEEEE